MIRPQSGILESLLRLRLETVRLLLRRRDESEAPRLKPAPVPRPDLARLRVEPPTLGAYDALWRGA